MANLIFTKADLSAPELLEDPEAEAKVTETTEMLVAWLLKHKQVKVSEFSLILFALRRYIQYLAQQDKAQTERAVAKIAAKLDITPSEASKMLARGGE